jgi:hypothetical protein
MTENAVRDYERAYKGRAGVPAGVERRLSAA